MCTFGVAQHHRLQQRPVGQPRPIARGGGDPPWHAVEDRVPAARTLLLTVRDPRDLGAVTDALRNVLAALGVHFEAAIRPLWR